MAASSDIVSAMENTKPTDAYEPPIVTELGRLEDLTLGTQVPGGTMENNLMKT